MASKSKEKGKRYERQVADFLSRQFDEKFIRVPNSGAFVGGKNAFRRQELADSRTTTFRGDIIPPDNWNLVIECKNYEKITGGLTGLIAGDSKQLDKWLKELRGDAGELESREQLDFHILFLKITRVGEWFIIPAPVSLIEEFKIPAAVYWFEGNSYLIFDIKYLGALHGLIEQKSKKSLGTS